MKRLGSPAPVNQHPKNLKQWPTSVMVNMASTSMKLLRVSRWRTHARDRRLAPPPLLEAMLALIDDAVVGLPLVLSPFQAASVIPS